MQWRFQAYRLPAKKLLVGATGTARSTAAAAPGEVCDSPAREMRPGVCPEQPTGGVPCCPAGCCLVPHSGGQPPALPRPTLSACTSVWLCVACACVHLCLAADCGRIAGSPAARRPGPPPACCICICIGPSGGRPGCTGPFLLALPATEPWREVGGCAAVRARQNIGCEDAELCDG